MRGLNQRCSMLVWKRNPSTLALSIGVSFDIHFLPSCLRSYRVSFHHLILRITLNTTITTNITLYLLATTSHRLSTGSRRFDSAPAPAPALCTALESLLTSTRSYVSASTPSSDHASLGSLRSAPTGSTDSYLSDEALLPSDHETTTQTAIPLQDCIPQ